MPSDDIEKIPNKVPLERTQSAPQPSALRREFGFQTVTTFNDQGVVIGEKTHTLRQAWTNKTPSPTRTHYKIVPFALSRSS